CRRLLGDLGLAAAHFGLALVFLAYQAWLMGDAVLRTLIRLFVTRRNLLAWVTAAQAQGRRQARLGGAYGGGAGGVVLALVALAAMLAPGRGGGRIWLAAPFLLLWLAAPAVAAIISRPPIPKLLPPDQVRGLRLLARRTWRFFEVFVTEADHMLPPDGFQQDPQPVVAHRTSPTNLGLYLLATVAAHDFGWLGTQSMLERLEAALASMQAMERHRGHFFNWYDTQTLQPLEPRYVSSVDSGNLAGHLLTVAHACREAVRQATLGPARLQGMDDALQLLRLALSLSQGSGRQQPPAQQLGFALDSLAAALSPVPGSALEWGRRLDLLWRSAQAVSESVQALSANADADDALAEELRNWSEALEGCIAGHQQDAAFLLPWTRLAGGAAGEAAWGAMAACFPMPPTLAEGPGVYRAALTELAARRTSLLSSLPAHAHLVVELEAASAALTAGAAAAAAVARRLELAAEVCDRLLAAMDFSFLLDPGRELLSLGYRVGSD